MKHRSALIPMPSRAALLASAVALFAAVMALRLVVTSPGFGVSLLFDVPVALVAIALGLRAGLIAATVGLVLFVVSDRVAPITSHGMALYTNGAGYLSKAVVLYLLGGLLGMYSDRLRRAADQVGSLFETAPDATVAVNQEGEIVIANTQAERLFGYGREELVGNPVEMLIPERSRERHPGHREGFFADPSTRPMGAGLELFARRKDGTVFPAEISLSPVTTAAGVLVAAAVRDVSGRQLMEEKVAQRAQLLDLAHDAVIVRDPVEGRVTFWNHEAEEIYGYSAEEAHGRITHELLATVFPDSVEAVDAFLFEHGRWEGELVHTRKDGGRIVIESRQALQRSEHGEPIVVISLNSDITERKRFEEQLAHLADHDPLTGLPNRRRLDAELSRHADQVARYGPQGALLVLDLDHFKYVNDSLGHNAGDQLIKNVAELLRARLRTSDTLARLGGDEFAVLLPRATSEEARKVAEDLRDTVREHALSWSGDQAHRGTTSIGIARFGVDGATAEEVLASADLAMYDAKEAGRDRVATFSSAEHREARRRAR